ncbi:MAG: thioredoxin family protein [Gemmatimonadota bacterium]|nr:thioredoxin family protein [Gemmatimonadota bacterium]
MTITAEALDFCALWEDALPFDQFVAEATTAQALWRGVHRQARLPEWAIEQAIALAPFRMLVLAEDWCNDAVSTIPILQRLAESVPGVELRVVRRDEHPEVMDQYLSDGARAIPIVIATNAACLELGHWGSRPSELQEWFRANLGMPKPELNREVRRWYARDRGESTLREVLGLVR